MMLRLLCKAKDTQRLLVMSKYRSLDLVYVPLRIETDSFSLFTKMPLLELEKTRKATAVTVHAVAVADAI